MLTPLEDAEYFYEKIGFHFAPKSHRMQFHLSQWKGSNCPPESEIDYPKNTYDPLNYDRMQQRRSGVVI
jgi:hypothetical protein